jgi:acyl dehydratase
VTSTTTEFNLEELGKWTDPISFEVEAERTIAYAKATNDENPRHLSGELAPPVFAIVPIFEALSVPTLAVVPGEIVMRVLHGEQDMHFAQPIRPGMKLVSRLAPVGLHSAPNGITLHTKTITETDGGDLVNEQWMIAFFRGVEEQISEGEKAPTHRVEEDARSDEPIATVEQTYDEDQTFRYSEASGDPMPIHLDDDIAKAMGLPGIIIHGLCTMAFNSRAVVAEVCEDDPERLNRLAVRFSRPALPKQTITTNIWSVEGAGNGGASYSFESTSDAGDTVIKDGLAEVAS